MPPTIDLNALMEVWRFCAGEQKTLWTYFITVSTAVIGFSFSDKYHAQASRAKVLLMCAYAIFALANAWSVLDNLTVYNAATTELAKFKTQLASVAGSFTKTEWYVILPLHVALDGATLLILWHQGFRLSGQALPLAGKQGNSSDPSSGEA
jgi:hypothetical protein